MCGEKLLRLLLLWAKRGSPPRVRGKVPRPPSVTRKFGITPACAGKRLPQQRTSGGSRDHPRVCGEKSPYTGSSDIVWGSPPRVRGKVFREHGNRPGPGITPACAGKRNSMRHASPLRSDHPRVCGEKDRRRTFLNLDEGSPPRVRGKVMIPNNKNPFIGITPACAGKSRSSRSRRPPPRDHPRVCGEKTKKIP